MSSHESQTWGPGHPIDFRSTWLDIYRLVTLFAASAFISRRSEFDWDHLKREYERQEAARLLVSIAATIRNQIDLGDSTSSSILDRHGQNVGELTSDLRDPDRTQLLSFRQACNKILHATATTFELSDKPSATADPSLNPTVFLYGELQGVEWKAKLDVFAFANCATALA